MKSSDMTQNLYYNYHKILSCEESKLNFLELYFLAKPEQWKKEKMKKQENKKMNKRKQIK